MSNENKHIIESKNRGIWFWLFYNSIELDLSVLENKFLLVI